METYEYTPPEKKEEPKNIDKMDKLFGTEPPQPKIPPQPKVPQQPISSPAPMPVGVEPSEKSREEKRKDALQKQRMMEVIDGEFRRIEQTYEQPPKEGFNLVSVILAVVIAAITLMIGLVVFANISDSSPEVVVVQESAVDVATSTGTAFNFMALGLFIMAAVFIMGIIAAALGGSD